MERVAVAHGMLCEEQPRDAFAMVAENRLRNLRKKEAEEKKKKNAELKRLRHSEDILTDLAFNVHMKLQSARTLVDHLTQELKEKDKEILFLRASLVEPPVKLAKTEGSIEANKTDPEPEMLIETGHSARAKRIRRTQFELLIQEGKK